MKRSTHHILMAQFLLWGLFLFSSCSEDPTPLTDPAKIYYKIDGRSVKVSDLMPIAIDLTEDGSVDFTVFVQLSATGQGDHLNAGINPIGFNLVKSGPSDENRFLNMGFVIEEPLHVPIDEGLGNDEQWTSDHSALVIRHTNTNGTVWYEGPWQDEEMKIVAIVHEREGNHHLGWMRLKFNKTNETVTLVDYAYHEEPNTSLRPDESIPQ